MDDGYGGVIIIGRQLGIAMTVNVMAIFNTNNFFLSFFKYCKLYCYNDCEAPMNIVRILCAILNEYY